MSSATKVPTEAPKGTVRGGLADLRAGLKQWPIWWTLPVERVKANYRRTYLGMLWMTLTTVVFVAGLSLLFGVLMGQDLKTFIPYVAIGFITGSAVDPRDRSIWILMGMVGLSTGSAVLLVSGLDTLLGSDRVDWEQVPLLTLTSVLYGLLLAPAVLVAASWVVRKATPEVLVG